MNPMAKAAMVVVLGILLSGPTRAAEAEAEGAGAARTQDAAKPVLERISEQIGGMVDRLRGVAEEVEAAVERTPQKLEGVETEAAAVKKGLLEAKELVVKLVSATRDIQREIDESIGSAATAQQGFLERENAVEKKIGELRRRPAPPEVIERAVGYLTHVKEAATRGAKTVEPVRAMLIDLRADAVRILAELELHPALIDEAVQVAEQYERLGKVGSVVALVEQLREARENLRKLYNALRKLAEDAEKAATAVTGQAEKENGSGSLVPRATRVRPQAP